MAVGCQFVVVSNTFVRAREFVPYRDLAVKYGYGVLVLEMTTQYESIHHVPTETIERMRKEWADEDTIYHVFADNEAGPQLYTYMKVPTDFLGGDMVPTRGMK